MTFSREDIRNIAIIAHVDHGKTTLVDSLLKQSNTFRDPDAMGTTIMDSNDIERERGITIFSKNAAITWKGKKINIVDTPGHADFGGEVERVMNLVDGCLLLVDAKEGPMPQTKFVLKKAIAAGHKIIVVINKVDKKDARTDWVLDHTFDLFVELGATDEQANFPVMYASAINGVAHPKLEEVMNMIKKEKKDVSSLLDTVVEMIPVPSGDASKPLQISVVNVQYDNYKGRVAIGRVMNGKIAKGQTVAHINRDGQMTQTKVTALQVFDGLARVDVDEVSAGDIVAVAGVAEIQIGETIADSADPIALSVTKIEEPTVKMTFGVNTSPFAGKEGQFSTSRQIKERLERELQNDVALRLSGKAGSPSDRTVVRAGGSAGEDGGDGGFVVSGRGELHLAILIEKMRREGYELQVSRPQVIFKKEDETILEPWEQVFIECPEINTGLVIEKMGKRRGEMKDMKVDPSTHSTSSGQASSRQGTAYLEFEIPTRGLIGFRSEFLTDTKGFGILNTLLLGYRPQAGEITANDHGSLISMESGTVMNYALASLQERGVLFVSPGDEVYVGQVVGQHARVEDIEVNPCKEKRLSNMRSKGDGGAPPLDAPRDMNLEAALEYIGDDELVEVTPKSVRIRKTILDVNNRRRENAKKLGL